MCEENGPPKATEEGPERWSWNLSLGLCWYRNKAPTGRRWERSPCHLPTTPQPHTPLCALSMLHLCDSWGCLSFFSQPRNHLLFLYDPAQKSLPTFCRVPWSRFRFTFCMFPRFSIYCAAAFIHSGKITHEHFCLSNHSVCLAPHAVLCFFVSAPGPSNGQMG